MGGANTQSRDMGTFDFCYSLEIGYLAFDSIQMGPMFYSGGIHTPLLLWRWNYYTIAHNNQC